MKKKSGLTTNKFKALIALLVCSTFLTQCTEDDLAGTATIKQEASNCATLCCDSINYCGISEQELNDGITNYRDKDWVLTSKYFVNGGTLAQYRETFTPPASTPRTTPLTAGDFDARYMDIDIEQLENYLCTIKKSNAGEQAKKLRLYYIRYGQNAPNVDYVDKHSLAMIPVDATGTEIVNTFLPRNKKEVSLIFDPMHCINSPIANHNNICPPEPPVGCSDRLKIIDRTQ